MNNIRNLKNVGGSRVQFEAPTAIQKASSEFTFGISDDAAELGHEHEATLGDPREVALASVESPTFDQVTWTEIVNLRGFRIGDLIMYQGIIQATANKTGVSYQNRVGEITKEDKPSYEIQIPIYGVAQDINNYWADQIGTNWIDYNATSKKVNLMIETGWNSSIAGDGLNSVPIFGINILTRLS